MTENWKKEVLFISQVDKTGKRNHHETYNITKIYFNEENLKQELLDVLDDNAITRQMKRQRLMVVAGLRLFVGLWE